MLFRLSEPDKSRRRDQESSGSSHCNGTPAAIEPVKINAILLIEFLISLNIAINSITNDDTETCGG
jgi:hypothetical protein